MQSPPSSPRDQLQWLVDRAAVYDVLTELAHRTDTQDHDGMAALFTEDGVVVLPFGSRPLKASDVPKATRRAFEKYEATHHLLGNVQIEIDGDNAKSHHYVLATHLPDRQTPARHADIGAWYDNEYRRTDGGWRVTKLELRFVYSDNEAFEPADPHDA